jgi:hypothetical protein
MKEIMDIKYKIFILKEFLSKFFILSYPLIVFLWNKK